MVPTRPVATRPVGASDPRPPVVERTNPLPVPAPTLDRSALIAVCVKALETLEHVHGHGLIHGDLKPENIFLRGVLEPVLVDFGVASPFNRARERLVRVPRSIGSVAYMAPECLHGALPDARSDLYAMGCVLYECLTGRHPLLRDSVDGTVLAHLHGVVPPPSQYDATIPRRWDTLVLRLLAKSAADRPGFARDAILALTGGTAPAPSGGPEASPPRYLHRAPMAGRAGALARLRGRLAQTDLGDANGKVLIRGARGMGKTRLAMEISQDALRQQSLVFRIECLPPGETAGEPLFVGLRALARALREHDAEEPSADVTAALDQCQAALEGTAAIETAVTSLADALVATAARRTAILLVDDVEHADELTADLLRRLAALELRQQRLMIVCTTSSPALDSKLAASFETVALEPLSEADVALAVRSMLALEHPSPTLVEAAAEVSQGNPFILGLYLRALVDGNVLRHDPHRGWHVEWPSRPEVGVAAGWVPRIASLDALLEWRVRDLSPLERAIAEIAALMGPSFDPATLSAVARRSAEEVKEALEGLCRREVLEARGAASYRFCHPLLAERLASSVESGRAVRLHRRAAAVMSTAGAGPSGGSASLAVHLRACGCHGRAARWFAAAGKTYVLAHHRREALQVLEAAVDELRAAGDGQQKRTAELLELHETIGDVALSLRQHQRSVEAYQSALAFIGEDHVRAARQYRKLASALPLQPEALDHLERAMDLLSRAARKDADWRSEWIQAHLDAMWIHYWKQRTANLLAVAARIEPFVRDWGSDRQKGELDFNMAVGLMQRNRYATGPTELSHVERALDMFARLDDRAKVSMCRFLRSMILLFAGQLDAAESGFEAVLALSEKATSVTIRVRALTFLCILHRKRRDRERVRRLAAAALSLATEHDMPEYRGTAMANLGWVALQDGILDECERLVREALDVWNASPLNVFRWTGLLPLLAAIVARPEATFEVSELARIATWLLDESQQALPGPVTASLEDIRRLEGAPVGEARRAAQRVLDLAATAGLIQFGTLKGSRAPI